MFSNKIKHIAAVLLALVLTFSLFCLPAMAAGDDMVFTDTRGNNITIPGGAASCATKVISFTPGNPWTEDPVANDPQKILGVPDWDIVTDTGTITLGTGGVIILDFDIYIYDGPGNDIYVFETGGAVEATKVEVSSDLQNWIYVGDAEGATSGVDLNGKVPEGGKYKYVRITDLGTGGGGTWPGADIDAVSGLNVKVQESSAWATPELQKAYDLDLIPDALKGEDLTKPITRAEFAAVAVKTYENLSATKAMAAAINPFTDTKDTEVLKAYNAGIAVGISATTFEPNTNLNREQCATMLTRVLKAAYIPGWTFATDDSYTLNYAQPAQFADDGKISAWAKPSVYFMAANGIISGMGGNMFAPRALTTAEQSMGYASATREQALVIAVRMVENLKDKNLDYTPGAE